MALRVGQLEEIQSLLLRAPGLIDLYEQRKPGFVDAVTGWLRAMEGALERNRMHVVALVARERGTLVAAHRGDLGDEALSGGRRSRRKAGEAAAVRAVREVSAVVSDALSGRAGQIDEAAKIARQILSIAALKGSVQPCLREASLERRLECMKAVIHKDGDLLPYWAALTGLVAKHDALVLLDRAVAELDLEG